MRRNVEFHSPFSIPFALITGVRFSRILLAAALGTGLAAAAGRAQITTPPVATSTNVSVWRGDRVPVTMRGFFGNNPVEYRIDRRPRHGALSAVIQPDPDRVSVSTDGSLVYTHDNSEESTSDEFTFRARAVRGGGLSAPATVRITIMDRPPVLAAPATLNFTAAAGESMTRLLGLTNAGGGLLEGDLRVRPPFEIIGDGFFTLPRGQSTNITIRYAPSAAGDTDRQPIQPVSNDSTGAQILLLGQSVAPFEVATSGGDFVLEGSARETRVTLRSLATQTQDVIVTAEPADLVELPPPVSLAPQSAQDIALRIPAERKGERREVTVNFSTPSYRQEITLVAPPVPAALALQTELLDFTRRPVSAVTVTNSGGVPGRFHFDPVPGLIMENGYRLDAREFAVPPDTAETIHLGLDLPAGAEAPDTVVIHLTGQKPIILPILAPEPTPSPSPRPSPSPTPPPPPGKKPWKLNTDIRLSEAERTIEWRSVKAGWTAPRLEVVRDGETSDYTAPSPPRGLMTRFGDWVSEFFGNLVPPPAPQPGDAEDDLPPPEWASLTIEEATAGDPAVRWVLTAIRSASGQREKVSAEFRVDWPQKTLEETTPVEPSPPGATPPPQPPPDLPPAPLDEGAVTTTRRITPALKVESARAAPTRHSARVQVIFPRDPEADSHRLEFGFHRAMTDEQTGLPYAGDFIPQPHPAQVQLLGTSTIEHEGRELTVLVADIEGLTPGSASLWRVVTMADGQDRWPTGEFQVTTLPPWQFPWRSAFLAAAFIALVAVLYLRWRLNRPPG